MEEILWQPWTAVNRKRQIAKNNGSDLISTFRKGTKWLRPELVGQSIYLTDQSNHRPFAIGRVISVKAVTFKDIDESDHARQSSDMTPENRLKVMQSVYDDFTVDTLTTIVTIGEIVVLETE